MRTSRNDEARGSGRERRAPPAGVRSWLARALGLSLLLATTTSDLAALPDQPDVTTAHGYAVFGELKYPADFKHLDYVNPDAPKGGTYRYAQTGSFDTLNFFGLLGTPPFALLWIYDTLMQRSLDEPASYYPLIAETISYPRDLAWVEFRLDPRARWHDGRPITPEDVIFTVAKFKELVSPTYRRIGAAVSRVEKAGPRSVRLYFVQKGNPTMPTVVAAMPVVPRHIWQGKDFTASTLERPVGSGPFRIGRMSPGRWLEMERVKDYWAKDLPINKGKWNFDIIRHDFYRDVGVMNEVFLSGQADLRFEGSAARWDAQDQMPAFRAKNLVRDVIRYENGAFYMGLMMNSRRPFLADRRVRKAITLAYDYEWVKRVLLAGHHGRLASFFANTEFAAEGLPGEDELALLAPFRDQLPPELFTQPPELPVAGQWGSRRENLVQAAALLREAGYRIDDGLLIDPRTRQPVRLGLAAYSALMDRQVSLFIENMRQLGITVDFRSYDTAQFRHKIRNFDFDLMINLPTFPPLVTPGLELMQFWSSQAADTPQSFNYMGVRSPVVDALVMKVGTATDRATVVSAMRALDRVLLWDYYAIPFQHTYPAPMGQVPITYWNRFGRPAKDPTYNFPFLTMDHWWIDKEKEARLTYGDFGRRAQGK
ncbi:ABC transporter substrate binding protein precursor [Sphingobium sp. SYK-6]|uniref:extracellular solute-binding protein n=1 Tax=Sphingobium sp. (strain NBRC 103272 / SYK-6) TaxID=627192 RepID=UPI00022766C2|nr:extracellular solute-binding protein [Sphingobium sp. SYK-6]BAK65129.1 ABC transporter substrate binding protein precursor [Sphingobium sp. SYK-6]